MSPDGWLPQGRYGLFTLAMRWACTLELQRPFLDHDRIGAILAHGRWPSA